MMTMAVTTLNSQVEKTLRTATLWNSKGERTPTMATSRHIELELLPVHLWEEAYLTLCCTMVQRVRTAAGVLPGNFLKVQSQDLSSFLYASKRYSSRSDHRLYLLVLERPYSPSLEHSLLSLLDSESLSLKPPSSSLIDGLLLRNTRVPVLITLPSLGRVRVASIWSRPASAIVDRVALPNEGRDDIYRLKPLKRYECCLMGLIVKSSIFPT